jgi:[ribosomal protein S18]-alanine N-acetyltransferase
VGAEPGEELSVRPARESDLSEIEAILELSREAGHWSASSLRGILRDDPAHFLCACQGQHISGFIVGRVLLDEGEILNLAVKPQLRRNGSGSVLVQALLEVFWREHKQRVFLEVRESNIAAIALYKRMGFQEIGKRTKYYQEPEEPALVLALQKGRTVSTYR